MRTPCRGAVSHGAQQEHEHRACWKPNQAVTSALTAVLVLIDYMNFYHFIPLSLNLTLARVIGSMEAETLCFIFLHTFQLIRVKFGMVLEQFN